MYILEIPKNNTTYVVTSYSSHSGHCIASWTWWAPQNLASSLNLAPDECDIFRKYVFYLATGVAMITTRHWCPSLLKLHSCFKVCFFGQSQVQSQESQEIFSLFVCLRWNCVNNQFQLKDRIVSNPTLKWLLKLELNIFDIF